MLFFLFGPELPDMSIILASFYRIPSFSFQNIFGSRFFFFVMETPPLPYHPFPSFGSFRHLRPFGWAIPFPSPNARSPLRSSSHLTFNVVCLILFPPAKKKTTPPSPLTSTAGFPPGHWGLFLKPPQIIRSLLPYPFLSRPRCCCSILLFLIVPLVKTPPPDLYLLTSGWTFFLSLSE